MTLLSALARRFKEIAADLGVGDFGLRFEHLSRMACIAENQALRSMWGKPAFELHSPRPDGRVAHRTLNGYS